MGVSVRFYGRLRLVTGREGAQVEGARTVGEALNWLSQHLDRRIKEELIDEAGEIDPAYALFLKGERVLRLDTPLKDGDELTITSLIAGGSGCLERSLLLTSPRAR